MTQFKFQQAHLDELNARTVGAAANVDGRSCDRSGPAIRLLRVNGLTSGVDIFPPFTGENRTEGFQVGMAYGQNAAWEVLQTRFPELAPIQAARAAEPMRLGGVCHTWEEALERFVYYVRELETMPAFGKSSRTRSTSDDGWFRKKARQLLRAAADDDPEAATRSALAVDSHDGILLLGRSAEAARQGYQLGASGSWREHVVPCNAVLDEAWKMAVQRVPECLMAQFLKCNLAVVVLTEREAQWLDSMRSPSGRNLRDNMPDGWCWGGDILARLEVAGIELEH